MAEIKRSIDREISKREADRQALAAFRKTLKMGGAVESAIQKTAAQVDKVIGGLKRKAAGVLAGQRTAPAGVLQTRTNQGRGQPAPATRNDGNLMDNALRAASRHGPEAVAAATARPAPGTRPEAKASEKTPPAEDQEIPDYRQESRAVESATMFVGPSPEDNEKKKPAQAKHQMPHWVEERELRKNADAGEKVRHELQQSRGSSLPIGAQPSGEIRILVTGSKDYQNHPNVCEVLERIRDRAQGPVRIISGPLYNTDWKRGWQPTAEPQLQATAAEAGPTPEAGDDKTKSVMDRAISGALGGSAANTRTPSAGPKAETGPQAEAAKPAPEAAKPPTPSPNPTTERAAPQKAEKTSVSTMDRYLSRALAESPEANQIGSADADRIEGRRRPDPWRRGDGGPELPNTSSKSFVGGAGPAFMAREWARANKHRSVSCTEYKVAWDEAGAKPPRKVRNQRMLEEGRPHLVVAFLTSNEDDLTQHMVEIADKTGVPVEIASENGRTHQYNGIRSDRYEPPPAPGEEVQNQADETRLPPGADKRWFINYNKPGEPTATDPSGDPTPRIKPSPRDGGDTGNRSRNLMENILRGGGSTAPMRGRNAPVGGGPPKPPAQGPESARDGSSQTAGGQGGGR